ncbi:MAG: maleylacetate reductase [Acidobacteriia bacterium]|nr:maleylacetate reductase [Terriglobia bacterium]MYC65443.1 maleylacetate reductase [Terriglobia bacterium]MYG01927.1 maleylacetate reductase [Terriglobia bacterium]MYK09919.1 maleylacetate reductase [Terriglobia bacterium]
MTDFAFRALPWNVVFGIGAVERLPAEMDALGLDRALVLCTPGSQARGRLIAKQLGDRAAGLFADARMHVPSTVLDEASRRARDLGAKSTVSIGGGSTTGLGKALAAREGLDNVAIPTTYSGSEMTDIWGVTESGRKVTSRDARVVPTLTIYDPNLTVSLSARMSASSGLNALAQAVVNVAADKPSPIASALAVEGIRALAKALPRVVTEPNDLEARSEALYGACIAAGALGVGSTGLHHRLCHTLGGTFGTPHAETHAILLPHSVAYNATALPAGTQKVADALGVADAPAGIYELAKQLGAPTALRQLGVGEGDLDRVAEIVARPSAPVRPPAPIDRVRTLLQNAFEGLPPQRV